MENSHLLAAMQAFISVVESGSFSESARRLGLAQSSVSRQINTLEAQLGVRLLHRTTRRLSLTEAGQLYYEKSRLIQRAVVEASQAMSSFKESASGLLRISAPHTWTEIKIAPHLGEFLRLYPEIKIDLRCNDQIQDMVEDRLDLVIRVGRAKDSSFIAVPFAKVNMVLCASPDYLINHGQPKTILDLHNHNFIMFDKYDKYIFSQANDQSEINIKGSLTVNSVDTMIQTVAQGVGISALPDLLIQQRLASGELVQIMPQYHVDLKDLAVEQAYAMYSSRNQMPAKVRAFLEFYKARF